MAAYLFYPQLADGLAPVFMVYHLADDREALARARTVLAEHVSAAQVTIWRDDYLVGRVAADRQPTGPERAARLVTAR